MRLFYSITFIFTLIGFISCAPTDTGTGTIDYVYADSGSYGVNLLDKEVSQFSGVDFSLGAFVPENGSLSIRITNVSGSVWKATESTSVNWIISAYDRFEKSQVFTVISTDLAADLEMEMPSGTYSIAYYEGDESTPQLTKEIKVN
jgi:hypothetical protein